jgi:hypothetical protein
MIIPGDLFVAKIQPYSGLGTTGNAVHAIAQGKRPASARTGNNDHPTHHRILHSVIGTAASALWRPEQMGAVIGFAGEFRGGLKLRLLLLGIVPLDKPRGLFSAIIQLMDTPVTVAMDSHGETSSPVHNKY